MIGRSLVFLAASTLAAFPAMAQQNPQKPEQTPNSAMQRLRQDLNRMARNNARAMELGDRQAWLNSLDNQTRLRAGLVEAWRHMGLPPGQAEKIADAYDPQMASRMHHTPMRGKTEEQVAALLQAALTSGRYLVANQLLIDYQRARLTLGEMATTEPYHVLDGN